MTLRRTFTALLLCAAVSTTTIAAPPEKEGGKGGGKGGNGDAAEFAPEILYQYNGRKSQDLRLTGIDGQSYVTVHSAPSAQLDGFTASDEQDALSTPKSWLRRRPNCLDGFFSERRPPGIF